MKAFTQDCYPEKSFSGLDLGRTWNGWACPLFSLEESLKVVEAQQELRKEGEAQGWETDSLTYLPLSGSFLFVSKDGEDTYQVEIKPEIIDGEKFYPLGSCIWCWYEKEGA